MNPPATIPQRTFGRDGPEVPVLALGSWNTWDRMDADEADAIFDLAIGSGASFFDVARYNLGPHTENGSTDLIFGKVVQRSGVHRDRFFVCGKLWLWDYPRTALRTQAYELLERTGLDRLDAVVIGDYTSEPPVALIVSELASLAAEGLITNWGINNWDVADTAAAISCAKEHGVLPPSFAQLKYSLVRRAMAEGQSYSPLFKSGSLGLQASDVLEGGILAGRSKPLRKIGSDVGDIRHRIIQLLPAVKRAARTFDCTAGQLALAFCLANPLTANVLFGASRLYQLEENLQAVALAQEHPDEIRSATEGFWLDEDVSQA